MSVSPRRSSLSRTWEGSAENPYQRVVQADVSFKARADMEKLDDGNLGRRDGQNVLHPW